MAVKTLVVQKDRSVREAVGAALARAGHEVRYAGSVSEAERALASAPAEAMIIDLVLPGEPAVSFLRRLRAAPGTRGMAIVVLSGRSGEDVKLLGFEAGADDYVALPFSDRELAARMDAILRRRRDGAPVALAGLEVDPVLRTARAGERELTLTPTEFRLLHLLMARAGRTLTRAQMVEHLRANETEIEERSVDTHINRLRRALAPSGHDRLIETVTGFGYRFSA
ncbi:MAG TPA: winged helix-turn-helix domain-containing protein [Burkholderiales bacterium]|nr:winged helix-turn-helix domain-containing protein [Burkholderiales bacterium]